MEYNDIDRTVTEARGFDTAESMHTYYRSNGYPGAERRDTSLRSDIFAAELATARTKAERRAVTQRFEASQREKTAETADEKRFRSWLRSPGDEIIFDTRAMGEGSTSTGGALVPQRFNYQVIHYLREYDALLGAFEPWESEHGEAYTRAAFSQFSSGATATENAAFTEGPYPVLAQQSWPLAPTYAGSYVASNQLVADAFASVIQGVSGNASIDFFTPADNPQLDMLVASALGESLGRAIAPVAQTALYATINTVGASSAGDGGYLTLGAATPITFASGATTELAANTISIDSAALVLSELDEAYLDSPNTAWYMSRGQWTGILRQQDAQKHAIALPNGERSLYGYPVKLTSQTTSAAASTVAGPVFGDLSAAMTLRTVRGSFGMLRSTERFAESLETYFRCWGRFDVKARDARAVIGVKYAAT